MEDEICCNNGCNNCVLDKLFIVKKSNHDDKSNILESRSYQTFKVEEIKRIAINIYDLKFKYDEPFDPEKVILKIPPACFLMLRTKKDFCQTVINPVFEEYMKQFDSFEDHWIENLTKHDKEMKDEYFSRKYTPYSVDEEDLSFKIILKLETGGRMSKYFQTLQIGSETMWKGPFESIEYSTNCSTTLLIFTQGICLTSSYMLIESILQTEEDETQIILISCFQNIESILFRNEIHNFNSYWNFKSTTYLSTPCDNFDQELKYKERILNRRLQTEDIDELHKTLNPTTTNILICGRESFVNFLQSSLGKHSYKNVNIL
ncbi:unnamed protein product [Diamesa serratosioi]